MSIASNIFTVDIPAGSYTAGQIIKLNCVYGSETVRSGLGTPVIKAFYSGAMKGTAAGFDIYFQNSNWIDPVINGPSNMSDAAALDPTSTGVQSGHNCTVDVMSTWTVYAKATAAQTTSADSILFGMIDIDYPAVAGVSDPSAEVGTPCSLTLDPTVNIYATAAAANWDTVNVDLYKPNARYLMTKLSCQVFGQVVTGFIAFANAAGMGGLSRAIPFKDSTSALSLLVTYAAAETKGPMDIKFMIFGTAAIASAHMVIDYVKRA